MAQRSCKINTNLLTDSNDIDELNDLVDEAVVEEDYYDEDKTAQDIEYEVISCDKAGNAVLKATFRYE
jgi:hypothetical protein